MFPQKRVMLVASGGGHWAQLSLMSEAFSDCDTLYVTTFKGSTAPTGNRRVKVVADCSQKQPVRLVGTICQILALVIWFRPAIVVSTGAAPGLLALRIGKILGAKAIWIDSMANSEKLSLSGRLAERHADLWLTQWPHLAEKHPGLEYAGSVL